MSFVEKRGVFDRNLKRVLDMTVAFMALLVASPILIIAILGIITTSPGPIFYKAHRMGKGGTVFSMFKLRTMHVNSDVGSAITSPGDIRVFGFGLWLRRLKIDELPQFWNILAGDMSLVGPRPEDPRIVEREYEDWMLETLLVPPGVTGPGSIYGYIYGDALLEEEDPEGSYVSNLLPPKLALERAYMERAGLSGDLKYIFITAWAVIAHMSRLKVNLPQKDIKVAQLWAPEGPYPNSRT